MGKYKTDLNKPPSSEKSVNKQLLSLFQMLSTVLRRGYNSEQDEHPVFALTKLSIHFSTVWLSAKTGECKVLWNFTKGTSQLKDTYCTEDEKPS